MTDRRRALPSVDRLLQEPGVRALCDLASDVDGCEGLLSAGMVVSSSSDGSVASPDRRCSAVPSVSEAPVHAARAKS